GDRIELRHGPGAASMDALVAEGGAGTFDMVFIDADKPNYPEYWERGLVLLRRGGLLVADNTLFQGMVVANVTDAEMRKTWASRPPEVQQELIDAVHALRAFDKKVHKDERVHLSMVPVADGMTFGVKL